MYNKFDFLTTVRYHNCFKVCKNVNIFLTWAPILIKLYKEHLALSFNILPRYRISDIGKLIVYMYLIPTYINVYIIL